MGERQKGLRDEGVKRYEMDGDFSSFRTKRIGDMILAYTGRSAVW